MKTCPHRTNESKALNCPGCPQFDSNFVTWKRIVEEKLGKLSSAYENFVRPTFHGAPKRENYRHRCRWIIGEASDPLGFYQSGGRSFLPIHSCPIHVPEIEELSNALRTYLKRNISACKVLSVVDIRFDGKDCFTTFCTHHDKEDALKKIAEGFSHATNLAINYAPKNKNVIMSGTQIHLRGKEFLSWKVNGNTFRANPQSFFQVNPPVLEQIHRQAAEYLKTVNYDSLYDFYSGIGVHSLSLSSATKKSGKDKNIVGFDSSPSAVEDANWNANNLHQSANFVVAKDTSETLPMPVDNSIAILNPSRSGLSGDILPFLANKNFTGIVYISCNADTLYRDLESLEALGFVAKTIHAFEMMPRTDHVEFLAFIERPQVPTFKQANAFWPISRALSLGISGPKDFDKGQRSLWIARLRGTVPPKGTPPGGKKISVHRLRKIGKDSIVAIESFGVSDVELMTAFKRWKSPVKGKVNGKEYGRPLLHCTYNGEEFSQPPGHIVSSLQLTTKLLIKDHFSKK